MSSSNGFRRCDGFAGSIPQNFINANMPVCPMCGTDDPYWLLKDKMEWTAHRILFRCSKCGCILSATNGDFTGTTKSTAYAVLTTAGAVNALTKRAQGKDVKTVYMRVEDVGDAQVSSALTGKELPIEELKAMAQAFSAPAAAPAAVPAADNQPEFKVSYGTEPAPAPVFEPAPAPVVEPAPAEAPAFKVSYGEPAPAVEPAVPVFSEAPAAEPAPAPVFETAPAPVVEPAPVEEPAFKVSYEQPAAAPAPEFRAQYAAPAPAAAPKKVVLKEKIPIFAIILMGIAALLVLVRFIRNASNVNAMNMFGNFAAVCGCVLMFVGMILHRKKGQLLTGIGSMCLAFTNTIYLFSDLFSGYRLLGIGIILDLLAMAAFLIAGLYYLLKKPALGMPVKLILLCLYLTVYIIYWISLPTIYGISARYFYMSNIVNILWVIILAVALIIYTPFKRNRV